MRTIRGISREKPDHKEILKQRIAELRDLVEQATSELKYLELEYDELPIVAALKPWLAA